MSVAFCDLAFELNLQPTHSHGNILDLVLTNKLMSPPVVQSQPPLPVNRGVARLNLMLGHTFYNTVYS